MRWPPSIAAPDGNPVGRPPAARPCRGPALVEVLREMDGIAAQGLGQFTVLGLRKLKVVCRPATKAKKGITRSPRRR
jgi:hypothetical protein